VKFLLNPFQMDSIRRTAEIIMPGMFYLRMVSWRGK
jgi:hypothetical protein